MTGSGSFDRRFGGVSLDSRDDVGGCSGPRRDLGSMVPRAVGGTWLSGGELLSGRRPSPCSNDQASVGRPSPAKISLGEAVKWFTGSKGGSDISVGTIDDSMSAVVGLGGTPKKHSWSPVSASRESSSKDGNPNPRGFI